jgi:protein Mpv17
MIAYAIRPGSRIALRKFPPINRQNLISKRFNTTNTSTPQPKPRSDGTAPPPPPPPTVAAQAKPIWERLGPLSTVLQAFGRSQRERPYLTQFCGSLVIYFIGDLSAQAINGDEYDPRRTGRALVISAGSSIVAYKWYHPIPSAPRSCLGAYSC